MRKAITARGLLDRITRPTAPTPARGTAAIAALATPTVAPLTRARPQAGASLEIAAIVPSFRAGSGGHATIVNLLRELRTLGHRPSLWLEDWEGRHARESPASIADSFERFFGADGLPMHAELDAWRGADVVLATGWQTVGRALTLPDLAARAYLVQDHEPDFYPASAEAVWAAETYRRDLDCIAASPWLAELLRTRYGARATHFDLAVDHELYAPGEGAADRGELVVFYARAVTPRRAVPLGLLALEELARRRPGVRIALFGEGESLAAPFHHEQLGVLDHGELAALYREATVGMVLSLTNPSLIGLEMIACGLPCVELASESMVASFGTDGPIALAQANPLALCTAIERLLDNAERRAEMASNGLELAAQRTWAHAAKQLEAGILDALAR